jgi:hypothetical protein
VTKKKAAIRKRIDKRLDQFNARDVSDVKLVKMELQRLLESIYGTVED